ncbi:DUF1329 domain-containing protein [Sinimarinibacterium sp. CAU 1509]|uniref:DUF1329 domain-containing protein n=1 Tax=Sinimarinibacterium sp. CAU 1509 TaxID=2562283 RepID=UPI001469B589|nr:DUF1329 domain-containing protein [Sinimarinibacterium sp. CAU 1509]
MRYPRWAAVAVLAIISSAAVAKVPEDQAARLGVELTPVGAEAGPSADGVIPAWNGGVTRPPACFTGTGGRYCDPYPDDLPLFVITAKNAEQYREHLSAGQLALLQRNPDTYRMPVYSTRRSFANPPAEYAASRTNALNAELLANGEAIAGASLGVPFPIPSNGHEVIWNHKTRFRDVSVQRWRNQFAVAASGDYNRTRLREDVLFNYSRSDIEPADRGDVLLYLLQVVTDPERLAGSVVLIHETMNPLDQERRAWQYSPGQRRLRRAPNLAYDNPLVGADGLGTTDQNDMFNGAMDRYEWKLIGKQTLYVPANSYRLHDDRRRYPDIVQRNHLAQDLTRYELRRVWVVEATLRPNTIHQYRKRRFYVDEDGWQIRVVDVFDGRDHLWRVQEAHTVIAYDVPYELPICETVYDLQSNRYLVQALNNEDPETVAMPFDVDHFAPGSVSRLAKN